jgi:hypothetical protein
MTQVKSRLKKLEDQCVLRDHHSLDALFRQAEEMVKHTGIRFEDAANEIVKDLTAEDLGSIIAEAVSQYGKEIVCNEAVLR